jgi:alpha-galactosidase/6-phospho-beta-glucosidase family protein
MSESLNMLKSEEGQLNAVFACFGSAAQHSQLFEDELRRFLDAYNKLRKTEITLEDLENRESKHDKKTMGALLKEVRKSVAFNEEAIDKKLDETLRKRNFLIHRFFLERAEKLDSQDGRMELLRELVQIEQDLETARGWIAGLRVAMVQTISGKREAGTPGETVFSVEIDIPD